MSKLAGILTGEDSLHSCGTAADLHCTFPVSSIDWSYDRTNFYPCLTVSLSIQTVWFSFSNSTFRNLTIYLKRV